MRRPAKDCCLLRCSCGRRACFCVGRYANAGKMLKLIFLHWLVGPMTKFSCLDQHSKHVSGLTWQVERHMLHGFWGWCSFWWRVVMASVCFRVQRFLASTVVGNSRPCRVCAFTSPATTAGPRSAHPSTARPDAPTQVQPARPDAPTQVQPARPDTPTQVQPARPDAPVQVQPGLMHQPKYSQA